jgi:hypothetical protein
LKTARSREPKSGFPAVINFDQQAKPRSLSTEIAANPEKQSFNLQLAAAKVPPPLAKVGLSSSPEGLATDRGGLASSNFQLVDRNSPLRSGNIELYSSNVTEPAAILTESIGAGSLREKEVDESNPVMPK